MRVLVTGSQGFIGRHVVATWLAEDPDAVVTGLGRSPRDDRCFTHRVTWQGRSHPAPVPADLRAALAGPRYRYVPIDLTDRPALTRLLAEVRPDVVVHLAAALRDEPPEQLVRVNVGAVVSLLESVVGAGIAPPRLVMGSSGSVYGVVPGRGLPLAEHMPCAPIDPYSASKRAAEDMARILADQHGLPAVWARIFNPVGPGQDERHLCGWLGQQVAAIDAGHTDPVISVGPLHTTRDYIDVRDTASALRTLALHGEPGAVYNVATGQETSGEQVLALLAEASGVQFATDERRLPARRVDMERHVADVGALRSLGWAPRTSLATSLAGVLAYYRDDVAPAASHMAEPQLPVASLTVRAARSHTYPVEVASGLLGDLPAALAASHPGATVAVLTDDRVHELYGAELVGAMRRAGIDAAAVVVPQGEEAKSLDTFAGVIGSLHDLRVDRRSLVVNLGGGTVCDLGGYVAASYLRGVAYVNVPTTLLAQHDSAIGGKVALNTAWAKNFIGAFHHPRAVYCDPDVLATLDVRNLRCGVAESIKVALCGAPGLFELLEDRREQILAGDPAVLHEVVRRSAEHKVALLAPDPYEVDLRRVLNLGHTFGHSLEVELEFDDLQHGEAVGYGLAVATLVARSTGHLDGADAERILGLIDDMGVLPEVEPHRLHAAAKGVQEIRLVRGGALNYVVPTGLRSVRILPELDDGALHDAVEALVRRRGDRPVGP
jgi:GDP-4-dehydro-6-deoxy-D-mannose reductase